MGSKMMGMIVVLVVVIFSLGAVLSVNRRHPMFPQMLSVNYVGTSAAMGGSLLAAGACAGTTVTITGARTGMASDATPNTYPGDGVWWESYVSANDTVIVKVCAAVLATPASSTYDVRVSP